PPLFPSRSGSLNLYFPFQLFPLLLFHYFSYQPEINEGQTNNSGDHIRRADNYEYAGIWILGLELLKA
ncbi:hypothetical protein KD27_08880, partial [Smithella sp. D17]